MPVSLIIFSMDINVHCFHTIKWPEYLAIYPSLPFYIEICKPKLCRYVCSDTLLGHFKHLCIFLLIELSLVSLGFLLDNQYFISPFASILFSGVNFVSLPFRERN